MHLPQHEPQIAHGDLKQDKTLTDISATDSTALAAQAGPAKDIGEQLLYYIQDFQYNSLLLEIQVPPSPKATERSKRSLDK